MDIAELVRTTREGLGISRTDLARRAGVHRMVIYRIEGGADIQLSTLEPVLEALGCALVDQIRAGLRERIGEFEEEIDRTIREIEHKILGGE